MKKKARYLGLGYLIPGAIFLFNPNINIIDLLPDFIGYLFIIAAISRAADLNLHLAEAKQLFKKLVYINLSRIPAVFLMLWITTNKVDERTSVLVLTFAYGVVELIYLIRAFGQLFEGIVYIGTRYDSKSAFYLPQNKKKTSRQKPVSSLQIYTNIFSIVKLLLPAVPYIIYLRTDTIYGEVQSVNIDFEKYKNFLLVICFITVLILGIIWLYRYTRYIKNILRDLQFINKLTESYESQIVPREGMLIKRGIKTSIAVLCIAFACGIDIYINNVNVIPDFISAIFFIVGARMLIKFTARAKGAVALATAYLISSLASYATSIYFFDNFSYDLIIKNIRAANCYRIYTILSTVEAVILAALLFLLIKAVCDIASKHTGYKGDNINDLTEKISLSIPKILTRRLYISFAFGVAAAVSSVLYVVLMSNTILVDIYTEHAAKPTSVLVPKIEMLSLYYFIVIIVWVIYSIRILRQLSYEVSRKYKDS